MARQWTAWGPKLYAKGEQLEACWQTEAVMARWQTALQWVQSYSDTAANDGNIDVFGRSRGHNVISRAH